MSGADSKPRGRSSRRKLLGRLVGFLTILTAAACVAGVAAWPKPQREVPPQEVTPTNVTVTTLQPLDRLDDILKLPGVVEPLRVVEVPAEVAGRIDRIAEGVEEGRRMSAGQEMIFINTDLLKADFDRARAAAEFDENQLERGTSLYQRGAATEAEVDAAKAQRDVSAAALDSARAMLARAVIKAPQAGVLNNLPVEVGEYVTLGQTVGEIVEVQTVKVVVDIPERDVGWFRVDETEKVLVPQPDRDEPREAAGKISFISVLADPQTRTFRCEIAVDNSDGLLRGGQIVKVHMVRRTITDPTRTILIPLKAVIPLEDGHVVYVVEDGLARQRRVKLGIMTGSSVQIASGLAAGDRLIVDGNRYVGPGKPVKVIGAETQPATLPAGADTLPSDEPAIESGFRNPDSAITPSEAAP